MKEVQTIPLQLTSPIYNANSSCQDFSYSYEKPRVGWKAPIPSKLIPDVEPVVTEAAENSFQGEVLWSHL
jgi:hypothetical protein